MNLKRLVLSVAVVSVAVATLSASGPLGIYGIVEKVVFEPNEQAPERIQVWGAFAYFESSVVGQSLTVSKPAKGYLYFRLGGPADTLVKNEWADLKSVAGTGQAVGFGKWGYIGGFGSLHTDATNTKPPYILERAPSGGRTTDLRVRPATEPPAAPALYQTDSGVVKLSASGTHAEIVQRLREALKR
jgi:hypothetical protein